MERNGRKYRNELKYLVDERDLLIIESKLRDIMLLDEHCKEGIYEIRSVYFDDIWDTALKQVLSGVSPRSKYRIRIYNTSSEFIQLEKKSKIYDMTNKQSCLLTLKECEELLKSNYTIFHTENDFLKRFKIISFQRQMIPKIIVCYQRKAFVCKEGNVRITFDKNISSSTDIEHFFDKDILLRPILPEGKHILEVKYDEFLPKYIKNIVESGKLDRTSYSKYSICRKYSI